MKRIYILILFLYSIVAFGQANILNAKSPDEIGQKSIYDEIDSDNFSKFQNEIIDILIKISINDSVFEGKVCDLPFI